MNRAIKRTPKAKIIRVRIEHAKTLLEKMDKGGGSISHRSGFASHAYFIKAFRREVGMTPQAYRKNQAIYNDLSKSVEDEVPGKGVPSPMPPVSDIPPFSVRGVLRATLYIRFKGLALKPPVCYTEGAWYKCAKL